MTELTLRARDHGEGPGPHLGPLTHLSTHDYFGSCSCKQWTVCVTTSVAPKNLNPRICDCDYCTAHPSAVISALDMRIELTGELGNLVEERHGDRLASFFRCQTCETFLAVGCKLGDHMRGAVNASLLDQRGALGVPVQIRPRLLSASEKLTRWSGLWGKLEGVDGSR